VRYIIVGCTEAQLCLSLRTPNLLTTLWFCHWFYASNSNPSEFNINSSGIKLIFKRLTQKGIKLDQGKRVHVPGLSEFLAESGSEGSNAESLGFEDDVGGGTSQRSPSGAGKTPIKENEEEEDNPDVHFMRKQKDSLPPKSRKKQVAKKVRRHAREASTAERMNQLHASLPWFLDY